MVVEWNGEWERASEKELKRETWRAKVQGLDENLKMPELRLEDLIDKVVVVIAWDGVGWEERDLSGLNLGESVPGLGS
ncbi:hypothetical protein NEUTE2DRAFT_65378 [Neurospora tetrasperma FGSC 2509]|nr:hypothetical protein NEUTE2DRAFT_65378 [Neurospora tetrasperma FGSC 2509]